MTDRGEERARFEKWITEARLKELLHYDPETGVFEWRIKRPNGIKVGDMAGSLNSNGYIYISLDGKTYVAHRLSWLYIAGAWPADQIDHINGIKHCNSFKNLREATHSINLQNQRKARSDNALGILGVRAYGKRFGAHIGVNGKLLNLGTFSTPAEAGAAYIVAKRKLHQGCTI